MKIILVTDYFYPLSIGGTEKYVYLLAKHLAKDNDVSILSIHQELKRETFLNLIIDYISANTDNRAEVISGILAPNNVLAFRDYLNKQQPDIVHFHTLTTNFNQYHTKISRSLGIKTYFTSHIPGDQCLRGDFIYHGEKPCDGKVEKGKCIKCVTLYTRKTAFQKISKYIYYNLKRNDPVTNKLRQLKAIEESTEKMIAVCNWQKEFFIKNGISKSNLSICRQEVSSLKVVKSERNGKLRLGFIGRVDPVKGLHVLIDAIKEINCNEITMTIAAILPSPQHQQYFEDISITSRSINCIWHYNLKGDEMIDFFKNIDYLVIPSLWYETGPFVAYEALAYNTPVIATNLGGQKELIIDGQNGFLFEPNLESLAHLITKLLKTKVLTRSTELVFKEENIALRMLEVYNGEKQPLP